MSGSAVLGDIGDEGVEYAKSESSPKLIGGCAIPPDEKPWKEGNSKRV